MSVSLSLSLSVQADILTTEITDWQYFAY